MKGMTKQDKSEVFWICVLTTLMYLIGFITGVVFTIFLFLSSWGVR